MSILECRRGLRCLAVVAGLAAAVACGGSGYGSSPSPMPTPTPGGGGGSADVTVTINGQSGGMSFSPAQVPVKVGQKVAWHNGDSIAHTATGAGFDTGAIGAGQTSAPVTFTAAGDVDYHCSIHPSMTGTLTITQ